MVSCSSLDQETKPWAQYESNACQRLQGKKHDITNVTIVYHDVYT